MPETPAAGQEKPGLRAPLYRGLREAFIDGDRKKVVYSYEK